MFAIPNGGHRHIAVAKRMKAEGQQSGVPDIFLPVARKGGTNGGPFGLFIEMKSEKGVVSPAQREWIKALREQGYLVEICHSLEQACEALTEYLET